MKTSSPSFPSNTACRSYRTVFSTQNQTGFFITEEHNTLNTSQHLQLEITFSSLLPSVFHYSMLYYFPMLSAARDPLLVNKDV